MKIKLIVALIVAVPVIVLDQITKLWIENALSMADSIVIAENFFHIRHIRNTAGAFGSFSWMSMTIFIALTVAAIGIIGYLYAKLEENQYAPHGWLGINRWRRGGETLLIGYASAVLLTLSTYTTTHITGLLLTWPIRA